MAVVPLCTRTRAYAPVPVPIPPRYLLVPVPVPVAIPLPYWHPAVNSQLAVYLPATAVNTINFTGCGATPHA